MKKILTLSILMVLNVFTAVEVMAQASALKVIPEVQQWTSASGTTTIADGFKIIYPADDDSLSTLANLLKGEVALTSKITPTVTTGSATTANAIYLTKTTTKLNNNEAYKMTISSTGCTIEANTYKGLVWGTRTLLQMLGNYSNALPNGTIVDYPNYPTRGFMIDVGRKFFSIDFLRSYVKLMSYYKMSVLHVHLNDNGFKQYYGGWPKTYSAFRLESEEFPGLTATDGHYTKAEFRDLQKLGIEYGVNVIPEFDVPAHSLAFTHFDSKLMATSPYANDHINIIDSTSRAYVYNFVAKLFDEYIKGYKGGEPTFIGPDVHIGTDEFVKEGNIRSVDNNQAKQFRLFTNFLLQHVAQSGKNPYLWGGLEWLKDSPETPVWGSKAWKTANLDSTTYGKEVVMNAWSKDWVNPQTMLSQGINIITTRDDQLYIVPGAGYYHPNYLDNQWIYNSFRPEQANSSVTLATFAKGLRGACFAVWNDICGNGITQLDVNQRAFPSIQAMGAKLWKVANSRTYQAFQTLAGTMGQGPGTALSDYAAQSILDAANAKIGATATVLNGKTTIALGGSNIAYNYGVKFDLKMDATNTNGILFQSNYGKIRIKANKLTLERDNYTDVFDAYTFNNDWHTVELQGNISSLTLYVDGQKVQQLGTTSKTLVAGATSITYYRTMQFPFETLGDSTNGFIGQIKNLQATAYSPEVVKAMYNNLKVTIPTGTYYIMNGTKYLTNTTATAGSRPTFQTALSGSEATAQKWKLSYDNGYLKIVNEKDNRYLNELGVFGTNSYFATWNTYQAYKNADGLYAIQNTQDAGNGFWVLSNNGIGKTDNDTWDLNNLWLTIKEAIPTGVSTVAGAKNEISVDNKVLTVVSNVPVKNVLISDMSGRTLLKAHSDAVNLGKLVTGVYLAEVLLKDNTQLSYKFSLK